MCDMHESDKYLLGAGIVLAPGDAVARKRWAQSSSNSYFVKKEAHVIGALQTWLGVTVALVGRFPSSVGTGVQHPRATGGRGRRWGVVMTLGSSSRTLTSERQQERRVCPC